jgi:hypothetical protein
MKLFPVVGCAILLFSPISMAAFADPSESSGSETMTLSTQTLDLSADTPEDLMMLNMRRQGSGTGWQPLDNPMLMRMDSLGPWMTMLHWNAFVDYDRQGGTKGRRKLLSQNWVMGSAARTLGNKGMLQLRAMMSAEPLTMGKTGYPLNFQAGEALNGQPLINSQHPHDLFMELSAQYWQHIAPKTWLSLYAAPVGEPALGPVAVPHRYAAFLNPEASLSHHNQDSTHVAFGVLTAGLVSNKWQLETSLFNGQESDANRFNFDFAPLKSYSARLSYMPTQNWAFQVSRAHLNHPEELEPGNINRSTASVTHIKTWQDGWSATSFVFGHNSETIDSYGMTLESTLQFKNRNYVYGRVENIKRHGLLTDNETASHSVSALSIGAARDLFQVRGVPLTLGAQMSVFEKSRELDVAYGTFPVTFHVYLHTNAPRMSMTH